MKRWIDFLIIGIMTIVIILLLFQCSRKPEIVTTTVTETIPGDPYPVISYKDKPVPYEVIIPSDTFWKDVDTAVILQKCKLLYKDYYSKNIYCDTLKDDTSALIVLIDTIYQNKLQKRILGFQNRRLTVINTTINNYGEIPVNKFYLGAGLETNITPFFSEMNLTANALLVMKKRWSYEFEIKFPISNMKNIGIGIKGFYKLSFKKK